MALLTATSVPANAGTLITPATAADVAGDTFLWTPGKRRALLVLNGSAAPITLTMTALNASKVVDGDTFTVPTVAQAIAAGEYRMIPVTEAYADATNTVTVTYSAVTTVTVRLLEFA